MKADAYLFGQVLGTHSFLLRGGFLQPDEYSEIDAQYFLPGGETGTACTVLSSLGVNVRMDGTHIGTQVAPMLKEFYRNKSVDLSPLQFVEDDPGVMDYVVIAGTVRSPMGRFQTLFGEDRRWWSIPREEDITGCRAASIDPFFRAESGYLPVFLQKLLISCAGEKSEDKMEDSCIVENQSAVSLSALSGEHKASGDQKHNQGQFEGSGQFLHIVSLQHIMHGVEEDDGEDIRQNQNEEQRSVDLPFQNDRAIPQNHSDEERDDQNNFIQDDEIQVL